MCVISNNFDPSILLLGEKTRLIIDQYIEKKLLSMWNNTVRILSYCYVGSLDIHARI